RRAGGVGGEVALDFLPPDRPPAGRAGQAPGPPVPGRGRDVSATAAPRRRIGARAAGTEPARSHRPGAGGGPRRSATADDLPEAVRGERRPALRRLGSPEGARFRSPKTGGEHRSTESSLLQDRAV